MKNKYQPQEFEKKWADQWEKEKAYVTKSSSDVQKKIYALSMFPYPSGAGLHVGHVRIYTGTDVLARFFRMNGYAVLHPMGWDAFGLPAENAAIKAKKNPMDIVPQNIATFKQQMISLGFSYDWEREFSTTDPSYYRWTQWFFIKCFQAGLLYKKDMPVYYCDVCKTGLAEEEVLSGGTHERCGNPITRKTLPQWVFRITAYADRLLNDLQGLDWPKGILEMQKNWIGKSEGAEIEFKIKNEKLKIDEKIKVFTTRPDTVFGTTALILAPEHPVIKKILENTIKVDQKYHKDIQKYVEDASKKLDLQRTDLEKEKTGVFTGLLAENPVNGENIPVWIADYVLGYYGHGAVMFVPAHDERDYAFAKKYGIDIRHVISPKQDGKQSDIYYTGEGYIIPSEQVKSFFEDNRFFDEPVSSSEFFIRIIQRLKEKNAGSSAIQYKLRDWIFSRQRYWGEPIPMIFCIFCEKNKKNFLNTNKIHNSEFIIQNSLYGWFPVPEDQLPVELPYVDHYEPTGTGESPLAHIPSFVKTTCPNCGKEAHRETDTMPNWAGSCWYFLRFADPKNSEKPWDDHILKQLLPVDWYLGGAEHAVLHLLYARFWVKVFQDLKLLDFPEPFLRLRNVGMVLAEDHKKMSKSLGNVINPDDVVKEFGADTLRIYEMFMAPFNQEIAWSTNALQGAYRFLQRIWNIYQIQNGQESQKLVTHLNKTIAKVTRDIQEIKYNTAIAAMMEFLNEWEKESLKCKVQSSKLSKEIAKKFLQILAPFAPFTTEEIWRNILGEKTSIHLSSWPQVKEEDLKDDTVDIPVQVNGKVRDVITVSTSDISEEVVVQKALESEKVKKHLSEKKYEIIYIPSKILNFVIR